MRRKNDFYPTPEWATEILLRHVPITGNILEPCVGDGAIARVVDRRGMVYSSDVDRSRTCSFYGDATDRDLWETAQSEIVRIDWVVTNPPFNAAAEIVPLAFEYAFEGIAMLLRLSYLEPVEDRGWWLNDHPPTSMIVTPRISFTGDGNTDSVTTAWMIWDKTPYAQNRIIVAENPRFPRNGSTRQLDLENNDLGRHSPASSSESELFEAT